eukprot:7359368-Prymnesium_polylepis.1
MVASSQLMIVCRPLPFKTDCSRTCRKAFERNTVPECSAANSRPKYSLRVSSPSQMCSTHDFFANDDGQTM